MTIFQGIKFKVISAIAIILTVFFSGLTAYIINDQRVKLMGALKERGSDVANLVSKNAVQPIKDFDDAILQEAILRVEQKSEIAYAQVFNTDNEPTIEEGMMLDGKETPKKKKPKVLPENILVIKAKIIDPDADENLGTVEIGFFLDAVIKEINKQIKIFIFGLIGLLTIVILIMYFYLTFFIITPVVLLAKAAENLDDESAVIDTERKDELGSLGRKFVEMRDAVRKRVDDLKTMNARIENQVRERTSELNLERNNIANLLNNMRQAVFTVSAQGEIMGPVSSFTEDIFGSNIIGTSIYETIYNGIDQNSELYSSIKSVMTCVYQADDLQWDIMKDYLPKRLTYIPKNQNQENKIIKTAYNPLWDQDEMLEKIMFVAEDITEIEKLEKEMAQQKEAASKNMQMLQELASIKKEDLKDFFSSAGHMIEETQSITKIIRDSIINKKEVEGLDVLFRHLHTIKGNSRVFGVSLVSTIVHEVESKVTNFINKSLELNEENITDFIQDLYLVQGQINEYKKVAKEVFNFTFGGMSEHHSILFNLVKEFELRVSYLIESHSTINKTRVKEAERKLQSWVKGNSKRNNHIKDLKRISHSIKGISSCIDERELSKEVHKLESAFDIIFSTEEVNKEDWDKKFIEPLKNIKELSRDTFIKTEILKEISENKESWVKILSNCFNLTYLSLHQEGQNKDKIRNYAYQTKNISDHNGLEYISLIMERILYLNEKNEEEEEEKDDIKLCLKEVWSFLSIVIALDVNRNTKIEERKLLKINPTGEQGLSEITKGIYKTKLQLFLKECIENGHTLNEIMKDLSTILETKEEYIFDHFIPEINITPDITKMYKGLIKKFHEGGVLNYVADIIKICPFVGKSLEAVFNSKDIFWFTCIKEINLLKVFKTYSESDDSFVEDSKPQVLEVLYSNFEDFKASLKEEENIDPSVIEALKSKCEKLLELPVKYSFNKFRPVVKEVAESLNKKIKFKLKGDQGSLNKDKLYLLQDSMMHLVRNSLDHGIETPEVRSARGKSEIGTVEIECSLKNPKYLRIIIRDDGGGIDADKICQKGVQKGLIDKVQAEKMSKKEKLELIFASTLSTKEEVSELSGRGVGMDVVKKNLEEIGSKIEIQTELGRGTEFIIDIAI
ncbi:MAG: hypothetical protein CME68_10585 [Halobacteriovoraceae bacterium]|nr:hypothetical protein [Halobacteriovoraceae bacterium]